MTDTHEFSSNECVTDKVPEADQKCPMVGPTSILQCSLAESMRDIVNNVHLDFDVLAMPDNSSNKTPEECCEMKYSTHEEFSMTSPVVSLTSSTAALKLMPDQWDNSFSLQVDPNFCPSQTDSDPTVGYCAAKELAESTDETPSATNICDYIKEENGDSEASHEDPATGSYFIPKLDMPQQQRQVNKLFHNPMDRLNMEVVSLGACKSCSVTLQDVHQYTNTVFKSILTAKGLLVPSIRSSFGGNRRERSISISHKCEQRQILANKMMVYMWKQLQKSLNSFYGSINQIWINKVRRQKSKNATYTDEDGDFKKIDDLETSTGSDEVAETNGNVEVNPFVKLQIENIHENKALLDIKNPPIHEELTCNMELKHGEGQQKTPSSNDTGLGITLKAQGREILADPKSILQNGAQLFCKPIKFYIFHNFLEWKKRGAGKLQIWREQDSKTYYILLWDQNNRELLLHTKVDANTCRYMRNSINTCIWAHYNYAKSRQGKLERLACRFQDSDATGQFMKIIGDCETNSTCCKLE